MDINEKRNYLVVGGSSGIGLALVRRLAAKGDSITVWSRTPLETENTELGSDLAAHEVVDVSRPLDEVNVSVPSPLHGLVYCPGTITLSPFKRLKEEQFQKDFDLNVLGAVRVLKLCLPNFSNEGASVVLFSTVAARIGMPYHASIATAKGAAEGLIKSLAAELASSNIRVNGVAPSLTDTPLAAKFLSTDDKREKSAKRHPLQRVGEPEDMAAAAQFLLSPDSSWITGQIISVDGGFSSLRILDG